MLSFCCRLRLNATVVLLFQPDSLTQELTNSADGHMQRFLQDQIAQQDQDWARIERHYTLYCIAIVAAVPT